MQVQLRYSMTNAKYAILQIVPLATQRLAVRTDIIIAMVLVSDVLQAVQIAQMVQHVHLATLV